MYMSKFKAPFVRSPYNYDVEEASNETAYVETMPSLTVQSQAEEADINVLMYRYGITGKFPENPRVPEFGDFELVNDFQSALHAVMDAQAKFMEYPAAFRARFENNPQLFLEFASNEANREEMRKLGMLKVVDIPPGKADNAPAVDVPPKENVK